MAESALEHGFRRIGGGEYGAMQESMEIYPRTAADRAMKLQEVLLPASAGKVKWRQAAELIGISERQMPSLAEALRGAPPVGKGLFGLVAIDQQAFHPLRILVTPPGSHPRPRVQTSSVRFELVRTIQPLPLIVLKTPFRVFSSC